MADELQKEIESLDLSIAAAKERVAECKRQVKEAEIKEQAGLLELKDVLAEGSHDQRKLIVVLYIMLAILAGLLVTIWIMGGNSITNSAALFVAVSSVAYFIILSTEGPYPRAARRYDAERAKLALKKKNHLVMLDEERADAEETITFQTAALEDLKKTMPSGAAERTAAQPGSEKKPESA